MYANRANLCRNAEKIRFAGIPRKVEFVCGAFSAQRCDSVSLAVLYGGVLVQHRFGDPYVCGGIRRAQDRRSIGGIFISIRAFRGVRPYFYGKLLVYVKFETAQRLRGLFLAVYADRIADGVFYGLPIQVIVRKDTYGLREFFSVVGRRKQAAFAAAGKQSERQYKHGR